MTLDRMRETFYGPWMSYILTWNPEAVGVEFLSLNRSMGQWLTSMLLGSYICGRSIRPLKNFL